MIGLYFDERSYQMEKRTIVKGLVFLILSMGVSFGSAYSMKRKVEPEEKHLEESKLKKEKVISSLVDFYLRTKSLDSRFVHKTNFDSINKVLKEMTLAPINELIKSKTKGVFDIDKVAIIVFELFYKMFCDLKYFTGKKASFINKVSTRGSYGLDNCGKTNISYNGDKILHCAIENIGSLGFVEYLVKNGADVNLDGRCSKRPIEFVHACFDQGRSNIFKFLVANGAKMNFERSTALIKFTHNYINIYGINNCRYFIQTFLSEGVDIDYSTSLGTNALTILLNDIFNEQRLSKCKDSHWYCVALFVLYGADLNVKSEYLTSGKTALELIKDGAKNEKESSPFKSTKLGPKWFLNWYKENKDKCGKHNIEILKKARTTRVSQELQKKSEFTDDSVKTV